MGRERTVIEKLDVKGKTINQIARWYFNGELFVNRRYQRKLVWTLEEKTYFIDSLINKFPTPSIMINHFEEKINGQWVQRYEIIDGLQRLDAIFSFIRGEFGIRMNNKIQYFDVSHIPSAGILLNDPTWKPHRNLLPTEICADFADSELPIILSGQDIKKIEDIFKRINSTGKKLSKQDLRQAGTISKFNDLVRITSSYIRGDYTEDDSIELSTMSNYSLNNSGLNYGVDINTIFWIEQGIILEDGIRRSKDEEIIANIYNCILNDYESGMSSKTLDNLYDETSNVYKRNENKLTPSQFNFLLQLFSFVIADLVKIFKENNTTFDQLLFENNSAFNKDLVFIIIFLSFVQLKNEHYLIKDFLKIGMVLENIADKELKELILTSNCGWNVGIRNRLVQRIKNILVKHMIFKENNPQWNKNFLELLKQKSVEGQMIDFKIGLHDLRNGHENESLLPKCIKTLIAMANTRPKQEGTIVIGISDKESDAVDYKRYYSTSVQKYNDYYVPGINDEALKFYGSIQNFLDFVRHSIEKENVDSLIIHQILTTMDTMKYEDQTLLVLKLSTDKPLFYNGKLYVRYDSNNEMIKAGSNEYYAIFDSFHNAKDT